MTYFLKYPDEFVENWIKSFDSKAEFLYLTDSYKSKILVKDITFNFPDLQNYENIICVGAEPLKKLFNQSGITKLNGHYETFYSKKADCKVNVGCLIDPSITQIYPEKEAAISKGIMNLLRGTKAAPKVEFHYPGHNEQTLEQVFGYLNSFDELVIDLETTGFNPISDDILGIVIAPDDVHSWYFEWYEGIQEKLSQLFKNKTLIAHNAKFDWKWLLYKGVDVAENEVVDSLILAFLSGVEKELGLKPLSLKYTDFGFYDKDLNDEKKKICRRLKIKVGEFNYGMFPPELIGKYACYDGVACYKIYKQFEKHKKEQPYQFMMAAVKEVGRMELNGAYIDRKQLDILVDEYLEKITKLELELRSIVAEKGGDKNINFNSPKQLGHFLYNVVKLPILKETETGNPSTSKEALLELKEKYKFDFIEKLLEFRSLNKFANTYLKNIKLAIDNDNRIRTSFNLTGTVSGRLSSGTDKVEEVSGSGLNFQNIPSTDKTIKKLFIAESPDRIVVNMDLKNAELWVIGVLANEPAIIDAFAKGYDIHSAMAVTIFNLDCTPDKVKELYPQARQRAKTTNFAILYQSGAWLLGKNLGITTKEAQALIDKWFAAFPNVAKWINKNLTSIQQTGEIVTYFGRYRYSPEVFSSQKGLASHYQKSMLNMLIQSVASDINLIAFSKVYKKLRANQSSFLPFALVHDSIVFTCLKSEMQEIVTLIKKEIQNVIPHEVPIGVDVECGPSWGEAK